VEREAMISEMLLPSLAFTPLVMIAELLDILRESGVPFVRADSGEGSDDK
jgi:hypothetical protein